MSKGSYKDLTAGNAHPAEDELLLYVDGELATKERGRVAAHLEACWSCRHRTEKIQAAISAFVDYRNTILRSSIEPPPANWRGFDQRLKRVAAEHRPLARQSRLSNARESLARMWRIAGSSLFDSPSFVRATVAALVAVVAVALYVVSVHRSSTVSANELLRRASEARTTRLRESHEPVVYQRIEVRRRERRDEGASGEDSFNWEIWHDGANARVRQTVTAPDNRRTVAASDAPVESLPSLSVLRELERIFQLNRMDARRPLSSDAYRAWRDSLADKREEVMRSQLGGQNVLSLKTTNMRASEAWRIIEATLTVRASDWHPIKQRLRVRTGDGEREYELTETSFDILDLSAVASALFPDDSAPVNRSAETLARNTPATGASPAASPALSDARSSLVAPPVRATASAETEIEILNLLHSINADLGEQISVERTRENSLRVVGLVETDARKNEIVRALSAVANNPAVSVEIRTVAERVAEERRRNQASPSITTQNVEVSESRLPVESRLRRHFAREGENTDEAVRQYAARIVARSRQAMRHLWAMRRLLAQFPPERQRALDAAGRERFLAILRSHAQAFEQSSLAVRRELQTVFTPASSAITREESSSGDAAELSRVVERLFTVGEANDRTLRAAFTVSPGASASPAANQIESAQFWQSLMRAEALAGSIRAAR